MTIYNIIGFRPYQFNDAASGRLISGTKFFCSYDDVEDTETKGSKTISFNCSAYKLGRYLPSIGDKVSISWADKKNFRVDEINKIE